jgi:5-methylcytosine-specific restriction enzyme A
MRKAAEYHGLYKRAIWLRTRKRKLQEKPLCERCEAKGFVRAANVVNHRVPHKGDLNLFLDWDNLESVCKECHDSTIQSEERLGYSKEIGIDGWPVDPRHPAIR